MNYYNSSSGVLAAVAGSVSATRYIATERGTVTAPAFAIEKSGDGQKGIYASSANAIAIETGGAFRLWMESSVAQFANVTEFDLTVTTVDINGAVSVDGNLTMEAERKLKIDVSTSTTDLPLQFNGDPNTGLYSDAADSWRSVGGGAYAADFQGGLTAFNGSFGGGSLFLLEGAGAGPAANVAYLYARDTAAKTELVAKMGAAGTIVPLAIEV